MKAILNKSVCKSCSPAAYDADLNCDAFDDDWRNGFVWCLSDKNQGYNLRRIDTDSTLERCIYKMEHIVLNQKENCYDRR